MPDPWQVLGVEPGASPEALRRRWLELSRRLHPDRNADPGAARRLAEVNEAYARLRRSGESGRPAPGPASASLAVDDFRPVVFEALVVAAADVGDVVTVDEPFSIDLLVEWDPRRRPALCRIELVPVAGGSVVSVDSELVDVDAVCDGLVAGLARSGLLATRQG